MADPVYPMRDEQRKKKQKRTSLDMNCHFMFKSQFGPLAAPVENPM